MKFNKIIIFTSFFLMFSNVAQAFNVLEDYCGNLLRWNHSTVKLSLGPSIWDNISTNLTQQTYNTGSQDAIREFNKMPARSKVSVQYASYDSTGWDGYITAVMRALGKNEAEGTYYYETIDICVPSWFFGGKEANITMATLTMNSSKTWTSQKNHPDNTGQAFQVTFLQELMHTFGLEHDFYQYSVMNYADNYGASGTGPYDRSYQPSIEDIAGMKYLYGWDYSDKSADLSVQSNIRDGYQQYRPLNFTKINSNINNSYKYVNVGDRLRAEIAVQNRGETKPKSHVSTDTYFQVGLYLSTNDWITTFDTEVGLSSIGLNYLPGLYRTNFDWHFVVPDVPDGWYHLGFIVDPYNQIYDSDPTNNSYSYYSHVCVGNCGPLTYHYDYSPR